jgi:hypothetical protein
MPSLFESGRFDEPRRYLSVIGDQAISTPHTWQNFWPAFNGLGQSEQIQGLKTDGSSIWRTLRSIEPEYYGRRSDSSGDLLLAHPDR